MDWLSGKLSAVMKISRITGLALAGVLCPGIVSALADEKTDRAMVTLELTTQKLIAPMCWDLPRTYDVYEKIVHDCVAIEEKYPDSTDRSPSVIIADSQRCLDVLEWEEWASTTDDPNGMESVVNRLELHFQAGQADEAAKLWREASQEYSLCSDYWHAVRELHPDWRPEFVADQLHACAARLAALGPKLLKQASAETTHGARVGG
jgi:hypothetical protein